MVMEPYGKSVQAADASTLRAMGLASCRSSARLRVIRLTILKVKEIEQLLRLRIREQAFRAGGGQIAEGWDLRTADSKPQVIISFQ